MIAKAAPPKPADPEPQNLRPIFVRARIVVQHCPGDTHGKRNPISLVRRR